ncbi:MAG: hypothetical protein JWO80_2691 [Bryobacterales bacterium]|nr:hypothetical protein [Bryobacterales bacterium]
MISVAVEILPGIAIRMTSTMKGRGSASETSHAISNTSMQAGDHFSCLRIALVFHPLDVAASSCVTSPGHRLSMGGRQASCIVVESHEPLLAGLLLNSTSPEAPTVAGTAF